MFANPTYPDSKPDPATICARISVEDKQRLVAAYRNKENFVLLADQLGIKQRIARLLIYRTLKSDGILPLSRDAPQICRVDEQVRSAASSIVESNPSITLKKISFELKRRFPKKPKYSLATVARICDGMLVTAKQLHFISADRNTEEVKNARYDYANWLLEEGQLQHSNIIYIDECSFSIWTRKFADIRNETRRLNGIKGGNLTFLLAISSWKGLISAQFHHGGLTKEAVIEFIKSISDNNEDNVCLIMENTPYHRNATLASPHTVKFLPAYSSALNPTKKAFSSWKAEVKRLLCLPLYNMQIHDRAAANAAGISFAAWRRNILQDVGEEALNIITQAKCTLWYKQCMTSFPACIFKEDI